MRRDREVARRHVAYEKSCNYAAREDYFLRLNIRVVPSANKPNRYRHVLPKVVATSLADGGGDGDGNGQRFSGGTTAFELSGIADLPTIALLRRMMTADATSRPAAANGMQILRRRMHATLQAGSGALRRGRQLVGAAATELWRSGAASMRTHSGSGSARRTLGAGCNWPSLCAAPMKRNLGTTGNSNQQGQQVNKQEEEGFYSPEGFPSLHVTR